MFTGWNTFFKPLINKVHLNMSSLSFARFLEERMKVLCLTNTSVAKRANISRQTWYRLLNADIEEAKLTTIIKLATALETHPLVLLRLYFSGYKLSSSIQSSNQNLKYICGFIADVTYPANSVILTEEVFTKVWQVVNLSKKIWEGYHLVCIDREKITEEKINMYLLQPSSKSIPIPKVLPGETVELSVVFKAPKYPGSVISEWVAVNKEGDVLESCFGVLRCIVKVTSI